MQAIEQALVSFFEQVAKKDLARLTALKQEQCFTVDEERWHFTLSDLHHYLQQHNELFGGVDYKQFRQLIFSSPINQTIKLFGAEIVIADNLGKVDKSRYALVWHAKDSR